MYYAITGAGGSLGKLVLADLIKLVPADNIIAATRHPELLADYAAMGVSVRYANFNDPSGLPEAFSGAERLLIISTGNYEEIYAGKRILQHKAAIGAALEAGVSHISYTSAPNASMANTEDRIIRDHAQTEEVLSSSGADWTALRNNMYMEGVSYFLSAFRTGENILVPESSIGKPCWVLREDCARTAAYVLSGKSVFKGAAEVTGPEAIDLAGLAARWSDFSGGKLKVRVIPEKDVVNCIVAKGMTQEAARGLIESATVFWRLFDVPVSDTVLRATGTQPASVDEMLRGLDI